MANLVYNVFKAGILDASIALGTGAGGDVIKVSLNASGYTADDAHDHMDDVTNELSGTGYQSGFGGTGRKTFTTKAETVDQTNNLAKFTADNFTWTSINAGTAIGMVIYKHLTSDAVSVPICWVDGGFPVVTNGGNVNVNAAANGWFYLT